MAEQKSTQNESVADKYIRQCIEEAITASAKVRGRTPARADHSTFREREKHWAPYLMHLNAELWYSCMAHILTRVQEADPDLADLIAAESRRYLDDGSLLGEFMYQWGAERGIDPEAMFEEARERYTNRLDDPLPSLAEYRESDYRAPADEVFSGNGREAYIRATSALSHLVTLANTEGADVALDKTLGAIQSAVADLGTAVS